MEVVRPPLDLARAFENEGMGGDCRRDQKRHDALGGHALLDLRPSGSQRIGFQERPASKPMLGELPFEDRQVSDNEFALFVQKGVRPSVTDKDPRRADVAESDVLRLQAEFDVLVISPGIELAKRADGVGARA